MGHASYADCRQELLHLGATKGVDADTAQEWIDTYGTNVLKIYNRLEEAREKELPLSEEQLLRAQLACALEEEMTTTAVDFLRLRTGWTYFQVKKAEAKADAVIRLMGAKLGWSEAQRERAAVNQLLETIHSLPENEDELAGATLWSGFNK